MSNLSSSQPAPQSAQPYSSIFGGSASQDVIRSASISDVSEGAVSGLEEEDIVMGDLPLAFDASDDGTYNEYDDEDSGSEDSFSTRSTRHDHRKRNNTSFTSPMNQKDPESPDASPPYRPNRFRGPESTWRKLTAEDRQNAQALEDIKARDLAAHLYNSYALRLRAREIAKRAAQRNVPVDESKTFLPPKRWAAWPVPANEVPRGNELRRDDEMWTLRRQPDPRPSAFVEEMISAVILKQAKETFNDREWYFQRSLSQQRFGTASELDTQDESAAESVIKCDSDFGADEVPLRPIVQADDEKAYKQVLPLTRNILTDVDRLLMGLHYGRKGGVATDDSSSSEWQTDTNSIASVSTASSWRGRRGTSEESTRSSSRGRKRIRKSSVNRNLAGEPSQKTFIPDKASSRSPSPSRGRSAGSDRKQSASRFRLGLRDWSEVLGVASMVGLPPAAVMRTAKRCATLFQEDMAFRTFGEGKLRAVQDGDTRSWEYTESLAGSPEPVISEPPSPPPVKRPRSRATSAKKGSVSRPTSAEPDKIVGPSVQEEPNERDLVCPLRSCSRHAKGFSRRWNLNLHMKRMHPGYVARRSKTKSPAASQPIKSAPDEGLAGAEASN